MTPPGRDWNEYFLRLEKAEVLVVLLSKAFFQSLACLHEVNDAIKEKLEIIPVRVEESESGAIDITRDTDSMWPDALIEKGARSETSTESPNLKLRRYAVQAALENMNTLPARGSLLTDSNALKELVSRIQGILN